MPSIHPSLHPSIHPARAGKMWYRTPRKCNAESRTNRQDREIYCITWHPSPAVPFYVHSDKARTLTQSCLSSSRSPSKSTYSSISLSVRTPTSRLASSMTTNRWTRDFRMVSKIVSRRSSMEQVYIPGKSWEAVSIRKWASRETFARNKVLPLVVSARLRQR